MRLLKFEAPAKMWAGLFFSSLAFHLWFHVQSGPTPLVAPFRLKRAPVLGTPWNDADENGAPGRLASVVSGARGTWNELARTTGEARLLVVTDGEPGCPACPSIAAVSFFARSRGSEKLMRFLQRRLSHHPDV